MLVESPDTGDTKQDQLTVNVRLDDKVIWERTGERLDARHFKRYTAAFTATKTRHDLSFEEISVARPAMPSGVAQLPKRLFTALAETADINLRLSIEWIV